MGSDVNPFLAEFVGTAILILLGNGVVANVVLNKTKGHSADWITICAGWAFAVFTAVLCVQQYSGAHINPAVTVGLAAAGKFAWGQVPGYVAAQLGGAMVGATLVYVCYRAHYAETKDGSSKLATFATIPEIRSLAQNFTTELVATFVLVYAVLMAVEPSLTPVEAGRMETLQVGLGSLGALPVALVVFAIGLSLGGPTGYAINPARDLGPRIAHSLLPIAGKRDSDWEYAFVPVLGPLAGGCLAATLFRLL